VNFAPACGHQSGRKVSREEARKNTKSFQTSDLLRLMRLFVAINPVGKISREEARKNTKRF